VTTIPPEGLVGPGRVYSERTATRYAIGRVGRHYGYSSTQIAAALCIDHTSVVHGWHRINAKADEIAAAMLVALASDGSDTNVVAFVVSAAAAESRRRRNQPLPPSQPAVNPIKARVAPFPPGGDTRILSGASRRELARLWPHWRLT
jgi:hypothetical protein